MEITFYELLDAYEFNDIESTLSQLYPDHFSRNVIGYEEAFEDLKGMDDVIESDITIHIKAIPEDSGYNKQKMVVGRSDNEDVNISLNPWREWLGMKIDPLTREECTGKEIICHCLWEMTFYGYNEESVKRAVDGIVEGFFELSTSKGESAEAMLEEISDLENENESKNILRKMFKDEIESSSSSDVH